jgi:hypothetical protein
MTDVDYEQLAIAHGCSFWCGSSTETWFAMDAPYDERNLHPEAGQPECPKWWDEARTRKEAARAFCERHHLISSGPTRA